MSRTTEQIVVKEIVCANSKNDKERCFILDISTL